MDLSQSDSIQKFRVEQIPAAFRTSACFLGPKGRNAAILQADPRNFITQVCFCCTFIALKRLQDKFTDRFPRFVQVPLVNETCSSEHFRLLLKSASEADRLHDVVLRVVGGSKPNVSFACHKFMLISRCQLFSKLFLSPDVSQLPKDLHSNAAVPEDCSACTEVVIENVHPVIMRNLLQLIYSGSCEMFETRDNGMSVFCDMGIPRVYFRSSTYVEEKEYEKKKVLRKATASSQDLQNSCVNLLETTAQRFGVKDAKIVFQRFNCRDNRPIALSNRAQVTLNRSLSSILFDCTVVCDDGISIEAHRCVLSARIPFFQGMLLSPWMETSENSACDNVKLKVSCTSREKCNHIYDWFG